MWVITGPFEGLKFDSFSRLLKPNHNYVLGRKERALSIDDRRISHNHCTFLVGEFAVDDVSDTQATPSLEVVSHLGKDKKLNIDKKISVARNDEEIHILPTEKLQLQHGDVVSLVNGIALKVEWKPIFVYSPVTRGKGSISIDDCAALGINLVYKQHPDVTHHLISHYAANLSTAASLLSSAYFVKPEWLKEVIRLGNDGEDGDGSSLEHRVILPSESKYRPAFSPSLLSSQKKLSVWEPSEERVKLFHECRFVCFREKVRESDSELQEAIHRGHGTLENFDVHSGLPKFHRTLTRSNAKEGKKTVVIADADSMQTAVGTDTWQEYVAEVNSFELDIKSPSQLIQAVLDCNVEILLSSSASNVGDTEGPSRNLSPLPDAVPNSIPDEPSIDIASQLSNMPTRKLVRRVTRSVSREPSVVPSFEPESVAEPVRTRKPLIRRVVTGTPFITGLDDPSSAIDAVPVLPPRHVTPPRDIFDYMAPTPARSTKLKRRVGVAVEPDLMLSGIAESVEEEPPLKKFKALFEASNPYEDGPNSLRSQTQSDIGSHTLHTMGSPGLGVYPQEEEEGTQSAAPVLENQRGQKRRLEDLEEDAEMGGTEGLAGAVTPPPSKRRATEDVNAVERHDPATIRPPTKPILAHFLSTKTHGAPAGKPDVDAAFLKAIASTKRGKKAEDIFDREFNQLKISKPEAEIPHDPEEEWGILSDFGDDSGLRGNFMTIVEMDLYQRDLHRKPMADRLWDGKANFKKFKKKVTGLLRAKVDVFLNTNDYGLGPAYWKNSNSQAAQAQNHYFGSQVQSAANDIFDSQDTMPSIQHRAQDLQKPLSTRSDKSRKVSRTQSLFLDSDNDIQTIKEENQGEEISKNLSTKQASRKVSKLHKSKVFVIDDSDDETVFRGFKG